jgi:hypothetical protein
MVNRVTCIKKPHPHSPVEHITHLGGVKPDGGAWFMTREKMITDIKSGKYFFHVIDDGYEVAVVVAGRPPNEYVKTKPDATKKDTLLSLPPPTLLSIEFSGDATKPRSSLHHSNAARAK